MAKATVMLSGRKPRLVSQDILNDPRVLVIVTLSYRGWTYKAMARLISRKANEAGWDRFSPGQVAYRAKKIGVSPMEWRRGESDASKEFADKVIAAAKKGHRFGS